MEDYLKHRQQQSVITKTSMPVNAEVRGRLFEAQTAAICHYENVNASKCRTERKIILSTDSNKSLRKGQCQ